ncbi:ABC transporter permease [Spongiactinospora sp. TRM90649]|uniref:ABC transporter permease n=1 Tax=Spongiactinospora sp. TRM90649 TaxID=3031114 RepID=UPI0023F93A2B|nr:ABC transporter permease [Spongiactinospora sp. TRM90649]MDF5756338.1 ABC transporter permease [Spongiactinospora sp. TRM90649]
MTAYLRLEVLRTLRSPAFVMFTIAFPVAFYLLFTTLFQMRPVQNTDFDAYYMVSMALYGSMSICMMGIGGRIAIERTRGWTRQLALLPLRPSAYISVKLASATLLTVPVIGLIMICGRFINDVNLPFGIWVALAPTIWLAALPFVALGIAIGYVFRDEVAQIASMTLYFVLSLLGGLWMPVIVFPDWLETIGKLMPTYRAAEPSWLILSDQSPLTWGLLILLGWTGLFAALAVWRYRRIG